MRISIATKVLIVYLFITYVPQTFLSFWNNKIYDEHYIGYADYFGVKIIFMAFVALAIIACQSMIRRFFASLGVVANWKNKASSFLPKISLTISVVYLALSIPFAIEYGFSFYHAGNYLSDLPVWVVFIQGVKSISRLILAYYFLMALRKESFGGNDKRIILINFLAGLISLMGAIDIVYLILTLLLMLKGGKVIAQIALVSKSARLGAKKYFYGLLIFMSFPGVVIIGFANKIGFENTFELIVDGSMVINYFIEPLALRVSSSHGSFVANAELPLSISEQVEVLSYPVNNFIWRGCIIFIRNNCPERADITHLARLNFIRSYHDQSPVKAGATPGLLASVIYFPILPVSLFILGGFCALVGGAIQNAVGLSGLNIYGILLILLFVYPLFENPIDMIIFFDPAVIYTIGMLGVLMSFPQQKKYK